MRLNNLWNYLYMTVHILNTNSVSFKNKLMYSFLIQYIRIIAPSPLLPVCPHLSPPPDSLLPYLPPEKSRASRDISLTQHKKIQWDTNLHIKAGRSNPVEGKVSKSRQKSQKPPLPLSGASLKHQVNNHNIHTEVLAKTHASFMIASSVSTSPHDPCLVDSMGLSLTLSSTLLPPTIPTPHLPPGFLISKGSSHLGSLTT